MKRLKNITLVTLILISVLLFSRVWFGANFVEEIKKNIMFASAAHKAETADFTVEGIITPENIIVTGGGKRNVISKGQDGYNELYERMVSAAEKLDINSERFFETDSDEWKASLKARSVLFDFAAFYDSGLIKKFGIKLPDGVYKNIAFVPSDSIAANSAVYIKNDSGGIYKFIANDGNDELQSIINKYAVSAETLNSPFAFELGFDKAKTNTEISQNVLLDSDIVIGLTEKNVGTAVINEEDFEFASKNAERLLETFGFNRNTTRRYIDKDDVTVYVDNTATLKIYPSYLIEYTSENGGYSVLPSGGDKESSAAYLNGIYGAAREIFRIAGITPPPMLASSDMNFENTKQEINFSIDYYVNSMPIYIDGENGAEHGINAVISGGSLKSYRQYLFNAGLTGETENIGSMINALDLLYEKFRDEKEVYLTDVFIAYKSDGNSFALKPVWCANTGKELIVINE